MSLSRRRVALCICTKLISKELHNGLLKQSVLLSSLNGFEIDAAVA
jgi:hypothetical protein